MPEYIIVQSKDEYAAAAALFREYAAWLNIDLCFQDFEHELADLKSMYGPPAGGIILCFDSGIYIGCVAIRPKENEIAELKRMFVKTNWQQKGIGSELLKRALHLAVQCGYKKIRLDTLSDMIPAVQLYLKNGFYEIPSYYHNPESTAVYFEKRLNDHNALG